MSCYKIIVNLFRQKALKAELNMWLIDEETRKYLMGGRTDVFHSPIDQKNYAKLEEVVLIKRIVLHYFSSTWHSLTLIV